MTWQRQLDVREFDDGVDQWRMVSATASPDLANVGVRYNCYEEVTGSFNQRSELASTRSVLLLNLGDPIQIAGPDSERVVVHEGQGFVAGICDETSSVTSEGQQRGIEISADIDVMERLVGLPLSELKNRVVSVDELDCLELDEAFLRLRAARTNDERFAECDRLVRERLRRIDAIDPAASKVRQLLQRPVPPTVKAIAVELGWSEKRVARRLRRHVGVSPSALRRLARFERFWTRLASSAEPMADLALDAGYFDQPHLSREVKAFSGLTPTQLRQQVLPAEGGFVAAEV